MQALAQAKYGLSPLTDIFAILANLHPVISVKDGALCITPLCAIIAVISHLWMDEGCLNAAPLIALVRF